MLSVHLQGVLCDPHIPTQAQGLGQVHHPPQRTARATQLRGERLCRTVTLLNETEALSWKKARLILYTGRGSRST